MRLLLLIATMSSLSLTAVAQWFDAEKVNKKAMTVYLQGMDAAEADRYPDAIKKMDEPLKLDPRFLDAWLTREGLNAPIRQ